MAVTVEQKLCPHNHSCPAVLECPLGALKQVGFKAPEVNDEICIDCGVCSDICPTGALKSNSQN